ncbi:MAG: hypothetical protein JO074_02825, partial [Frankiales bacterium]|nr:hypothetical protein [Frankiales bacterium]
WSTPIFIRQDGGPSLTGKSCGSSSSHGAVFGVPSGTGTTMRGLLAQRGPIALLALTLFAAAAVGRGLRRGALATA